MSSPDRTHRSPFLKNIRSRDEYWDPSRFPFNIPAFSRGIDIALDRPVTFFVGENGSGKSTLLEAMAANCGFNAEGGSGNHWYSTTSRGEEAERFAKAMYFSWAIRVAKGFFV